MKRFLVPLFLSFFIFILAPVQANDYLEREEHYEVSTLTGSIHFKLPVFSRGGKNYYVQDTILSFLGKRHTRIYLVSKNDPTKTVDLFHFHGETNSDGPSGNDKVDFGYAYLRSNGEIGSLILTNEYSGYKHANPNDSAEYRYTVTKKKEVANDMDYVTWLEIDWYPPESMKNDTFDIKADIYIYAVSKLGNSYAKHWTLKRNMTGINNLIDPQLMEPYFYATSGNGNVGHGIAAVPYSLFYDPVEYYTSFDTTKVKATDRVDHIYVQATDSIQSNFNATFTVFYSKEDSILRTQKTQSVSIPAYHKIYDFTAIEQTDSTNTYTGKNVLTWTVRNPQAADLVDGDYFEIQRAMKADYSDAETVSVEMMERGEGKGSYSYKDESRSTWTGQADTERDTLSVKAFTTIPNYEVKDGEGNTLCKLNLKLQADHVYLPAVPVYYRIRRASSSVWGWIHEYAKTVSLYKHNFLTPLANNIADYTKDANYNENHKVHFSIQLDNKEVTFSPNINECSLSYELVEGFSEEVQLTFKDVVNVARAPGYAYYTVYDREGNTFSARERITADQTITVPREGTLHLELIGANGYKKNETYSIDGNTEIAFYIAYGRPMANVSLLQEMSAAEKARFAEIESTVKQQMFLQLESELKDGYGRCMWDRTARLVLIRSSQENPDIVQEFIIPQDSIRRQADGSWKAFYTDIANRACTHYTYAVRIDQSSADIHVKDSIDLQPKIIAGESLYYDEAATITSFTATQGAAQTELKRGVLLNWRASSEAVDEYILLRKEVGSSKSADTLYTGLDVIYFDATAKPSVHYDYTIVASYNCNGKHSENNASAEGWRTPYGEISGAILMPDNSGIAGVTVTLQKDGEPFRSLTTGASGAFKFDSLLYDIAGSTEYVIVPTATYGTFRYNNTSAGTAAITLSADNAVALGINFENADGVRLSGRALYDLSTIPVAGAMFVLNGDTVRRNGAPLTTGVDGNFELTLTKAQPYTLQIVKPGHTFVNEGYLEVTTGERTFALSKPLDGVRFYDQTKVRLVGRVAGGIDQRDLPAAFGRGTNNLGDDLTLVLQLEGDNTAHFVHDPQDLTRDTLYNVFAQKIYDTDSLSAVKEYTVGTTTMLTEKKRITIHPDPNTGEYAVELYPVKYKVIQATATGYATLFASGQGSETFDLTNAPLSIIRDTLTIDAKGRATAYNAVYDRIYRSPVQLTLSQYIYGLKRDGLGEPQMEVEGVTGAKGKVDLYSTAEDGTVSYLLNYPLYYNKRQYQFEAFAHEDYYYNNEPSGKLDRVPERGGEVVLHNGLHDTKKSKAYKLDDKGKTTFFLDVDNLNTEVSGTGALCSVSAVLKMEGASVETAGFQAFVVGSRIDEKELTSTEAEINILDIVRDPGGNGSSAWVENGTTYTFSYTDNFDVKVGVELYPEYGGTVNRDIGIFVGTVGLGPVGGSFTGSHFEVGKTISFTIPIVFSYSWGHKYTYSFTTTEKISTSTKKNKAGIGGNADVFLGATTSILSGKAKSIAIIDDNLFRARKPAIDAGAMHVLASGMADGQKYHLVTGEKVVLGTTVSNTFAWSQHYIINTVIPKLALEASGLLEVFANEQAAQAAANARDEAVYWYIDSTTAINLQDTLAKDSYKFIVPQNSTKAFTDRVGALENMIAHWLGVLYDNEKEKVMAREAGKHIGTYSVNYGNTYTHSDSYSATYNINSVPIGTSGIKSLKDAAFKTGTSLIATFFNTMSKDFGASISTFVRVGEMFDLDMGDRPTVDNYNVATASSKWKLKLNPVLDFTPTTRDSKDATKKKSTGFTLVPDDQGDITVSVHRAPLDSVWKNVTKDIREAVDVEDYEDLLYGSYVFFTEAGNTYCTHEQGDTTLLYKPGTLLSNPTVMIAKPELSIDTYEQTNVPADQRAIFRVELRNAGSQHYGQAGSGTTFNLSLSGTSNPDGAKVYINGAPLVQPLTYYLLPGQSVVQTMEVERGIVDDYNNLQLFFTVGDCGVNNTALNFSVHFLPESSPVALASPRQGWVMNTLSPHDSAGYYLPIDINGFNVRHKNFDHIEFQYKLALQSDDDWTNMCSFYADDSLYALASGNKAMIENGRITPFRFYGERDPMEQQYDLRAVSFCRHGSGFVTKSSPVISGIKDTRPPRVFGAPQPANAILGVGDDLKLRFNEAIAGNYLDEDNNFQLLGVTNATGITTGTSLHFDGSQDSYVGTKVGRTLSQHSISIDMLVKPTEPNRDEVFFSHEEKDGNVLFGKTADNRLYADINGQRTYSQPLQDPMLDFTRVIVTYDNESKEIRFYAGTLDITNNTNVPPYDLNDYNANAPLVFGRGFKGNMLEVRVWTKVLTPEEIALTHLKRLSGYERELAAYYPMNEGRGETLTDKANGATLYTHGATWTNKSGISLALTADQRVQLNSNVLSRSDKQDFTLMFWFKAQENGTLFSCDKFSITTNDPIVNRQIVNNEWHHYVLAVNRTMNSASTFVDGEMIDQRSSDSIPSLGGAMYLGGDGFAGNFDEFVLFEQALPKTLMDEYSTMAPVGDEMGIIAYLPFSTLKQNASGVLEQVFSINDQRVFRDANGKVVNKVVPLVLTAADAYADKANFAPLRDHGQLTKLKFDWAFNNDELLININMADREINKQEMYITVRDVEDLHGNPMVSPATWTAFVDRNALKWEYHQITMNVNDNTDANAIYDIQIINNSGKRHQYAIESMPSWLTVNRPSGAMDPMEEKSLRFTFSNDIPVGVYSDIIYLSDEDGLLDPLRIEYTVAAVCPYDEPDEHKYPLNMSICGEVKIGDKYDTDSDDRVIALFHSECVGMTNIEFDDIANTSKLFLTVYGDDDMARKEISFQLWQASTGKLINLSPSRQILFAHGYVYGCGDEQPVIFTTIGSETQNIELNAGWTWISTNLQVATPMSTLQSAQPWSEGDQVKNAATLKFNTYSQVNDQFIGDLKTWDYTQMYMVYAANANTLRLGGEQIAEADKHISLRGDGQWNSFPCLFDQATSIDEALADYYDHASAGDLLKAHDRFAVFSTDKRWEGDLKTIHPGEGYLFRRMGAGTVTVNFYSQTPAFAPQQAPAFRGKAASNMTMICTLNREAINAEGYQRDEVTINAFIGEELVGVATQMDSLYFLTISSEATGTLRFATEDGTPLKAEQPISYIADAHHGSLKAPIILKPDDNRPYKIIENNHVIIIRNNEKYDVTGKKL